LPLRKILLVIAIAAVIVLYFALDLGRWFSLDAFKAQQAAIESWRAAQPLKFVRAVIRSWCCVGQPVSTGIRAGKAQKQEPRRSGVLLSEGGCAS